MKSPLIAVCALLACTDARTPVSAAPAPSEETVCARYCARLASCEIAPKECERGCARDRMKFRDGFFLSMVGCLDGELSNAACSQKSILDRRQSVSSCFSATLHVFAEKDDGASLRRIVASVCAREARCHPADADPACAPALETKLRARITGTIFAGVRPELASKVAACIDASRCGDDAVVDVCTSQAMP